MKKSCSDDNLLHNTFSADGISYLISRRKSVINKAGNVLAGKDKAGQEYIEHQKTNRIF